MFKKLTDGRIKTALDGLSTIAFIAACGAVVWLVIMGRPATNAPVQPRPAAKARPEPPLPADPVSLDGAVLEGDKSARVAVIEFSEFQCPFCGKFANETQPALKKKYVETGKVLWAFRHFPLEKIHANAVGASMAAECASRQGRFWALHDLLFRNQTKLEPEAVHKYAQSAGLDASAFDACMKDSAESAVRAAITAGENLAITGTPTFFIGLVQGNGTVRVTRRFSGALPAATFEKEIDNQVVTIVAGN